MVQIRDTVEAIVDRKTNTVIESLFDRLVGRYSKQEVTDPKTGEVIIESDEFISEAIAQKIVRCLVLKECISQCFHM